MLWGVGPGTTTLHRDVVSVGIPRVLVGIELNSVRWQVRILVIVADPELENSGKAIPNRLRSCPPRRAGRVKVAILRQ